MKQGKITMIIGIIMLGVVMFALFIFNSITLTQDNANKIICEDRCKEHNQIYIEHTNNMFKNNVCYCDNNGKTEDYMI